MKIRLLAIDSKMVNLAILKIAQYHINQNDDIDWYNPLFDLDCDILYISKIFTFTDDLIYLPLNAKVIKGGSGYDIYSKLPDYIENITDISQAYLLLYPNINYSIIFTTRGCVRNCDFCLVRQKEGLTHDVIPTTLNPNGKWIEVLDNNFFSSKSWELRLDYLNELVQPLNWNTGIDVRTLTEKQAQALGKCKIKAIHIAWDNLEDEKLVRKGIETLIKYVSPSKITCYVLVGFKQPYIIDSDLYRVNELHKYKITPFAMGFIDLYNKNYKRTQEVKDFQRYVNRYIFKTVEWLDYRPRNNV